VHPVGDAPVCRSVQASDPGPFRGRPSKRRKRKGSGGGFHQSPRGPAHASMPVPAVPVSSRLVEGCVSLPKCFRSSPTGQTLMQMPQGATYRSFRCALCPATGVRLSQLARIIPFGEGADRAPSTHRMHRVQEGCLPEGSSGRSAAVNTVPNRTGDRTQT